jgi:hypothetical protein
MPVELNGMKLRSTVMMTLVPRPHRVVTKRKEDSVAFHFLEVAHGTKHAIGNLRRLVITNDEVDISALDEGPKFAEAVSIPEGKVS